ncbi:unnamed protein product [Sympodiomycopsis kandeliae]
MASPGPRRSVDQQQAIGSMPHRTRVPSRGHNRTGSGSSFTSIGSASSIAAGTGAGASGARTPRNGESFASPPTSALTASNLRNSSSFDAHRTAAWADSPNHQVAPAEGRRTMRSTDLARLDEVYEGNEEGQGKSKGKTKRTRTSQQYNRLYAPTPPPRRTSLSAAGDDDAQDAQVLAQRQIEAEKILKQAFGKPQAGTLTPTPVPGGDAQLESLFAPLRRSFSAPSVRHRSSAANLSEVNQAQGNRPEVNGLSVPSRSTTPLKLATLNHRNSGLLNPKQSMTASRSSLANPRLSMDPQHGATRRPSTDGGPMRNPFRIEPRVAGGPSVDSFASCDPGPGKGGLPSSNFLSPSVASFNAGGRGSRFDAGGWTFIESSGLPDDPFAQGDRLLLHRVTSEPTAGPMIRDFMESRVPTFAREPPHDMAEAVQRAGKILDEKRKSGVQASKGRDARFWLTFFAVFVTAFLSAVDLTIISPILPTIAEELPKSTISPTWITSAFLATSASFQPLFGGLSDAIGRRESLLLAIIIFLVGSVVACIARDMLEIVIGRGIQGLGGGGMLVVGEIIISDMTTLAERGYFLGLLSIAFAVAALAAPIAGGWFATFDWRVSFYINFPIGVVAILMLIPAKLSKPKLSLLEKFQRTDIVGSLVLFGSITSLLIGLTNGGVQSPWTSAQILIPLACGGAGLVLFLLIEFIPNPLARYPILPAKLFRHRTAAIAYLLTFLHGVLLYGASQGLVLYFENRGASPLKAAINILPANAPSTPAAFVAGIVMAITGKYKGQIIISEALMTIGLGLCIYLNTTSSTALWTIFQLIASFGLGALYSLTLPPIQATVPAHELAHATATFAFSRSFGAVWGVSAFLIAFQVQAGQGLSRVPGAAELGITGGTAIDFVPSITKLPDYVRDPLAELFQDAIRVGFIVLTPFAAAGFFASFFIKHVPLPDFNDSKYGVEGQNLTSAHRAASMKKLEKSQGTKAGTKAELNFAPSNGDPEKLLSAEHNAAARDSGYGAPSFTSQAPLAHAGAAVGVTAADISGSSGSSPSDVDAVTQANTSPMLASSSGSWWSRRMSFDSASRDPKRLSEKLEKQRTSLEHRRMQLQKKSMDLERQYELLQAEIDRNRPAQPKSDAAGSTDGSISPFPSTSSPRATPTDHHHGTIPGATTVSQLPTLPELSSGTIRAASQAQPRPGTADSKGISSVGTYSPAGF